ncbi:MAG: hypothetical protein A3B37_02985 [Candidatus Sungbacteria bacterium RIFCSPLOWO2_01_FULL_59_16]|uniref:Large ribosomal subunit protein uL15 n=1 Tax=Candidatus Sungbacteria bacterium RIFCSPLOWO2_01_FULL_59_16 TaxID=1802280 RepID=A0A1G2LBG6_9BACT|nr:MAG: hypothetical protein A3B37_02985 [Candidatus Sungbacteria bacterium RIFCSPLOWO2_01_FULL_59_16]
MQSYQLKPKTRRDRGKRVGRGGKRGTTAGRGTKGQKARAGAKIRPAIRDLIKKLPKLRGRGKHSFRAFRLQPVAVDLTDLAERFPKGGTIDARALLAAGLIHKIKGRIPTVKIIGTGELKQSITLRGLACSRPVRVKIEAAGGTVRPVAEKPRPAHPLRRSFPQKAGLAMGGSEASQTGRAGARGGGVH